MINRHKTTIGCQSAKRNYLTKREMPPLNRIYQVFQTHIRSSLASTHCSNNWKRYNRNRIPASHHYIQHPTKTWLLRRRNPGSRTKSGESVFAPNGFLLTCLPHLPQFEVLFIEKPTVTYWVSLTAKKKKTGKTGGFSACRRISFTVPYCSAGPSTETSFGSLFRRNLLINTILNSASRKLDHRSNSRSSSRLITITCGFQEPAQFPLLNTSTRFLRMYENSIQHKSRGLVPQRGKLRKLNCHGEPKYAKPARSQTQINSRTPTPRRNRRCLSCCTRSRESKAGLGGTRRRMCLGYTG